MVTTPETELPIMMLERLQNNTFAGVKPTTKQFSSVYPCGEAIEANADQLLGMYKPTSS